MGTFPVKYRFVTRDVDRHGNARFYFRTKGAPKIRLEGEPGTALFAESYRKAVEGQLKPARRGHALPSPFAAGSLFALARDYQLSAEFRTLAPSTQAMRRNLLDALLAEPVDPANPADTAKVGDCAARLFTKAAILRLRDRHADRPEGANNRVKVLSQMFGWAVERANETKIEANPCAGVKRLVTGSEGFHTWRVDEVHAFLARHESGTMARLALELMLHGLRRSDVVRVGRQHLTADGGLQLTLFKGRTRKPVRLWIKILPPLKAEIERVPAKRLTFLVNQYGRAFTAKGFGNTMRRWCDEAGLPHCSAHGLRKAAATIAAQRGGSIKVLNALFGWTGHQQAQRYTEAAEQKLLAELGAPMMAIERAQDGNENVPPEPPMAKGETKTG